jgi:hypothetical protein
MDQEIQDKYDEAEAFLGEMIDAFQDEIKFKRKYSAFVAACDSVLEYIKNKYKNKINSSGEEFNTWFGSNSSPRWGAELTHLTRARGYNIHFGYIPTGATRCAGYSMDFRIVTEEQAAKEREARSNRGKGEEQKNEALKNENIPPSNSQIETIDRWLVDEYNYMKYRTYDSTFLIPIIRNQYPAKWSGFRSGNQADVMSLCMAYLVKIKDIMNTCQKKWP